MSPDYYELLHITAAASFDEVHKAYRTLALQFHPDRNSKPEAAAQMIVINEAYAVLSDPARRKEYDYERTKTESFDIAGPILRAAHETLLKQGWAAVQNTGMGLFLERERRSVRVSFVARLNNALLKKMGRQFAGFSVVMAVQIETPINLSLNVTVIDLMRSSHHGAPFPDEGYRELFAPFL